MDWKENAQLQALVNFLRPYIEQDKPHPAKAHWPKEIGGANIVRTLARYNIPSLHDFVLLAFNKPLLRPSDNSKKSKSKDQVKAVISQMRDRLGAYPTASLYVHLMQDPEFRFKADATSGGLLRKYGYSSFNSLLLDWFGSDIEIFGQTTLQKLQSLGVSNIQTEIPVEIEGSRYRVDFSFEDQGRLLYLEIDGSSHHSESSQYYTRNLPSKEEQEAAFSAKVARDRAVNTFFEVNDLPLLHVQYHKFMALPSLGAFRSLYQYINSNGSLSAEHQNSKLVQVTDWLKEGKTYKDIATLLGTTLETVQQFVFQHGLTSLYLHSRATRPSEESKKAKRETVLRGLRERLTYKEIADLVGSTERSIGVYISTNKLKASLTCS